MSTLATPASAVEDPSRKEKAQQIFSDVLAKYNLTPDELRDVLDHLKATAEIVKAAKQPFPFNQKETMSILREPMTHSWLHPLTNLAHKLLRHHEVVDEPYMVGGLDQEPGSEASKGVVCMCFYATVRFQPDEIRVYSNHGMGGMCPEDEINLVGIHKAPDFLKQLYPQLEQIADQQMRLPIAEYETPKRVNIRMAELESSGPQL
ncbi:hypothetical protein [Pseudomonas putida]|uniref:Uncharacterized protein n=1 Tax=Pseudomonas putida TaxID=303 RepID=A0A8I1JHJ1_PSEPU|nr:hypothetical protein [Pseudomonas putida]MBI6882741.1 hypothetical protein [Pseudomonas putida]